MPLENSLDMNLIWPGIVLLISLQIGLITPPFGMSLCDERRGLASYHNDAGMEVALPFVGIVFLVLFVVIVFSSIAMLSPMAMR